MITLAAIAAGFCLFTTMVHLVSLAVVSVRCCERPDRLAAAAGAPPVTIIRPVCRIDNFERETLASSFGLDYPDYEIIFCVAHADDPVAAIVHDLMAEHPGVPARLLVGEDRRSSNPKLNNVLKGWDAARHRWIIMADSNVLMPPDYVQRLMRRWRRDTGLVCSMPIGSRPGNFWASLECAFLNTFEARWQYVGETLGFGFAQGKSMLFERGVVDRAGGLLRALGSEAAEDAAFTRLIHEAGLRVHLVDTPFEQPLGCRTFAEVWGRQRRWATLRRTTFPLMFAPEILTGALFPILAGIYAARIDGHSEALAVGLLCILWFGAEALLARSAGWHFPVRMLLACVVRDALVPALWVEGWLRHEFNWRGNEMDSRRPHGDEVDAG